MSRLLAFLTVAVPLAFSAIDHPALADVEKPTGVPARAVDSTQPEAKDSAEPAKEVSLDISQQALANRFERFQTTLLQMAEQMRKTDPDRADLLFRALSKSQEERIIGQMRAIEQLLTKKQFGDSVSRQEELSKALYTLLELLQSENRLSDIDAERKRIEGLLKDVNRLIGKEKDVRAATERGGNTDRLGDQQKGVSDETKQIVEKIDGQDAAKKSDDAKSKGQSTEKRQGGDSKPSDKNDQSGKPSNGEKPESKPNDPQRPETEPSEKDTPKSRVQRKESPQDQQPDAQKPGEKSPQNGPDSQKGQQHPGQPQQGQPQPGQPQQGQPQQGQQQPGKSGEQQDQQQQNQDQTPGRQDLEQARQEMEQAIEDLKKQDRNQASRRQDEALKRLLEAKEKFEEILRQLREEEKKLTLMALEARFRKMLGMQLLVYNDTVNLAKSGKREDPNFDPRARLLARNEDEIVQEVDKALVLLREEGSSVAFPEATEAIRDDMLTIVQRLDRAEVGELTQTVEQGVIEALEEMIDAMQKELEKQKDQQQQQQQQQQQDGEEQKPLVDTLAELKMLRSLQLRINRRTKQLARLIEGEQASDPDVVEQLQTLSRRQSKIQEATYDLATGRNR